MVSWRVIVLNMKIKALLTLVSILLILQVSFAQETFTALNGGGIDLWTQDGDWTASVGSNRQPDCTNDPITIVIPAGVTTVFRNYDADGIAEFTCVVNLEVYGTLSFRNNDGDATGLWLNNPNSTVYIAENGEVETIINGAGDATQNYLQINNTVVWNGDDGTYVEDSPGGVTYEEGEPLPIELLSFNVFSNNERGAEVSWSTLSELNNDYFSILRSTDGETFTEVARVPGAGTVNEPQHYTFVDHRPLAGLSFYQLMQTDFDGQFEKFKIKQFQNGVIDLVRTTVYPNPTYGQIMIAGDQWLTYDAELMEITGKRILSIENKLLRTITEDVNQLLGNTKRGTYYLRLTSDVRTTTHRILLR